MSELLQVAVSVASLGDGAAGCVSGSACDEGKVGGTRCARFANGAKASEDTAEISTAMSDNEVRARTVDVGGERRCLRRLSFAAMPMVGWLRK